MFERREDVYIVGGARELEPLVSGVDDRVQRMSQSTEDIKGYILRKAPGFAGEEFQRASDEVSKMSDVLYEKSIELNRSQRDLVEYIHALDRFNRRPLTAVSPRNHTVHRVRITMNTANDIMTREDVLQLTNQLREYCNKILEENRALARSRDEISNRWRDGQNKEYSRFIDEINQAIDHGVKALTTYTDELIALYKRFYDMT